MTLEQTDYDKLNAISMMKTQLVEEIKENLLDTILAEQLAEFESKIRPIITEKVESISFDCIETFQDYLNLRNEMRVRISINDTEHEKTMPPKYLK